MSVRKRFVTVFESEGVKANQPHTKCTIGKLKSPTCTKLACCAVREIGLRAKERSAAADGLDSRRP